MYVKEKTYQKNTVLYQLQYIFYSNWQFAFVSQQKQQKQHNAKKIPKKYYSTKAKQQNAD